MSLTKLPLAGNNSIIPGQGEFGKYIPAEDEKISNLFLQCKAPCTEGDYNRCFFLIMKNMHLFLHNLESSQAQYQMLGGNYFCLQKSKQFYEII